MKGICRLPRQPPHLVADLGIPVLPRRTPGPAHPTHHSITSEIAQPAASSSPPRDIRSSLSQPHRRSIPSSPHIVLLAKVPAWRSPLNFLQLCLLPTTPWGISSDQLQNSPAWTGHKRSKPAHLEASKPNSWLPDTYARGKSRWGVPCHPPSTSCNVYSLPITPTHAALGSCLSQEDTWAEQEECRRFFSKQKRESCASKTKREVCSDSCFGWFFFFFYRLQHCPPQQGATQPLFPPASLKSPSDRMTGWR